MATQYLASERFLSIYNEIDKNMRKTLNASYDIGHTTLLDQMATHNRVYNAYKSDLKDFANLRNAIVHHYNKDDVEAIAEPHENIVNKYEYIRNMIINPPNALDSIAIKSEHIYRAKLDDNAYKIMSDMAQNVYTHVPVYDNDNFIGIFSENSIFSYIVSTPEVLWDNTLKILDFLEFLPINKHISEDFVFRKKSATVFDIEDVFKKYFNNQKRVAVVFITINGKSTEPILGMITAWDLAGIEYAR